MDRDRVVRRALATSFYFNLGGGLLFLFPDALGPLAGMPTPAPRVYTATIAVLVLLFGATYRWLSRQPVIDRPLVVFGAIGKAAFFGVVLACWLTGEVGGQAVLTASGDLVFAAIFSWWLLTVRSPNLAD